MAYNSSSYFGGNPNINNQVGRFYNPARSSYILSNAVYSHKNLTYIGGIAYQSPGRVSHNNEFSNISDNMVDIRAEKNIELYAPFDEYLETKASSNYHRPRIKNTEIIFSPNDFLRTNRPMARWVGRFEEVKDIVEKIFYKVTNRRLPNIEINIITQDELFREYEKSNKRADDALQGFYCDGRIFVKEGRIDEMLITLGHELGHASSLQLSNPELEEAKAYAFTEAWVKTIISEDIEGLSKNIETASKRGIIPEWAHVHLNGYKAFKDRLRNGLSPMEIIENLTALDRAHII